MSKVKVEPQYVLRAAQKILRFPVRRAQDVHNNPLEYTYRADQIDQLRKMIDVALGEGDAS